MQVKIKKSVLLNFFKKLNESSRGDSMLNNSTGFYGNFGSVKSFNSFDEDSEELPVQPGAQMAMQLSIEEPPVDDPEYVPGTSKELGLAMNRIAKEVPFNKIEFFYRKAHHLLDSALDEQDANLFEAVDYDLIANPAHKRAIKDIIGQAIGFVTRSKNPTSKEEAALFAMQQRMLTRYPSITLADVIDEIEQNLEELPEAELADAVGDSLFGGDLEGDPFVNPPSSLDDISPSSSSNVTKGKKRKIATTAVGGSIGDPIPEEKPKKKKSSSRRNKNLEEPSDGSLDKKAESEMMHLMASAYSEYIEMDEYAATWDWSNYQYEAPLLKVIFDLIKILHQLSYRLLQANYINKYGGYIYDPEADVGGKTKGGFVLEKQGPTSRPEAQAMMRRINSDFGLTYETMMRQQNILKMKHEELVAVIERAMMGIFRRIPNLYSDFIQAVAIQDADKIAQGADVELIRNEAFGFVANVLAHKYRGESEVLDRDLVNVAIAGIFKRCLLDLPVELGFSPSPTISLDAIGKKKTQKTDITRGFNLAGAMKRFEKLRKDPKIAKEVKKLMPGLIVKRITDSLSAKVTKKGSKYNFEDKSTGLGMEVKATDLKKKIKDYVEQMLKGKVPSFAGAEDETEPEDMGVVPYDEDAEEKAAKERLSADDFETRKIVKEMEKMIASGDWMHIAPLFGFSGAPGVRQWYLRYPERKFMIMTAARSDSAPQGAKTYLEVFRKMRENLGNSLITLNNNAPGVLDLLIDEISNKKSLATSDQAMIELLEEMKGDIEELLMLYDRYESYEELEEKDPEELRRLSNTPGGSLLRFGMGSVFDKIIKDMDTEWHAEMKAYLSSKNGLKDKDAHDLAYYFTGLKNKPSKGDFSQDKEKLSKAAASFVNVGMQAEEFFKALRYSQKWFFSTLDRELQNKADTDNYYKMVRDLTSQPLYVRDKKNPKNLKLDKKVYNIFKKLVQGNKGAIASYLDNLAIEQFQQKTQEKIKDIKANKPEIFNEIKKVIKAYVVK